MPHRFDVVLAGAVAVVGVLGTIATDAQSTVDRPVDGMAIALVVTGALALSVRRRWPLAVLAVTAATTAAFLTLGYPYGPVFFAFFASVYTVAAYRPLLPTAVVASAVALLALLPHLFTHTGAIPGVLGIVPATAWVVVPLAVGVTVRLTREARDREREDVLRRRVDDERLRIAQEVHDVVGHGLAAIKMQADVALHLLARKPEQAEQALTAISRTSTEALDEVRATLAAIRLDGQDSQDSASRAPTPGLHRLEDLRRRMAEAGMSVDVDTEGTPRELPAAADLAAYRIVQESLTNVLRHSARKIATVRVGYHNDAVQLVISNPVDPATEAGPRSTGYGLAGMAERVTGLGGEFAAGPTGNGRFEVRASIPTGGRT